jgi:hypothetical protein
MMTYKEIFNMVAVTAYNRFPKGFNYEGLQNCIVENATKIYIEQMRLEKEKLQQEYDDLCEGHDKLSYEWAKLKKENRELNKKYSELLEDSNRKSNESVEEIMTLDDWLKEKEEEKNAEE